LDAVSLVSWMAIIDGGFSLFIRAWSPGSAIFSVPQFHESIYWLLDLCGGCAEGLYAGGFVWIVGV
jgi:hypothetical protein